MSMCKAWTYCDLWTELAGMNRVNREKISCMCCGPQPQKARIGNKSNKQILAVA